MTYRPDFHFSFVLILTFVFSTLFCVSSAHAQKIKELFDKEMPKFEVIPDDKFEEMSYIQEDTPYGDKYLAYSVPLPNEWKAPNNIGLSNYNLSTNLMGDVAVFFSPPRIDAPRSKFEINALRLEYEVTAEHWLLKHILSNGYTLEGLEYYDKDKVGALFVYVQDGETYVVRCVAQINGRRMILAQYVVPASYWHQESAFIDKSIKNYKLLNPERLLIENMKDYLFLDIAGFKYPESWTFRASPVRIIDRMEVSLNNIRKGEEDRKRVLDGQINVEMVSAFVVEDLEEELDKLKASMRKKNLLVGELMESKNDIEFAEGVEFGFVDVFEGTDTQNNVLNYEIWVSTFTLGDYFIFASMITPHRDKEFFTWSRNFTAFRHVIKSMYLQERALDEVR